MATAIFQKMSQGLRAIARFFIHSVLILMNFFGIVRWLLRGIFGSLSYQVRPGLLME